MAVKSKRQIVTWWRSATLPHPRSPAGATCSLQMSLRSRSTFFREYNRSDVAPLPSPLSQLFSSFAHTIFTAPLVFVIVASTATVKTGRVKGLRIDLHLRPAPQRPLTLPAGSTRKRARAAKPSGRDRMNALVAVREIDFRPHAVEFPRARPR